MRGLALDAVTWTRHTDDVKRETKGVVARSIDDIDPEKVSLTPRQRWYAEKMIFATRPLTAAEAAPELGIAVASVWQQIRRTRILLEKAGYILPPKRRMLMPISGTTVDHDERRRMTVYVEQDLGDLVFDVAATKGITVSAVVNDALRQCRVRLQSLAGRTGK